MEATKDLRRRAGSKLTYERVDPLFELLDVQLHGELGVEHVVNAQELALEAAHQRCRKVRCSVSRCREHDDLEAVGDGAQLTAVADRKAQHSRDAAVSIADRDVALVQHVVQRLGDRVVVDQNDGPASGHSALDERDLLQQEELGAVASECRAGEDLGRTLLQQAGIEHERQGCRRLGEYHQVARVCAVGKVCAYQLDRTWWCHSCRRRRRQEIRTKALELVAYAIEHGLRASEAAVDACEQHLWSDERLGRREIRNVGIEVIVVELLVVCVAFVAAFDLGSRLVLGERCQEQSVTSIGVEPLLRHALEQLDEGVKVAHSEWLCLARVPFRVGAVKRRSEATNRHQRHRCGSSSSRSSSVGRSGSSIGSSDAQARDANVGKRWCWTLQPDGTIHLGGIECPVAQAYDGDRWLVEYRVQHLERHRGAELGETHLVEHQHGDAIRDALLIAYGRVELAADRVRVRHGTALVRHHVHGRERAPEGIGRLLALEVAGDDLQREGLGGAGHADQEDRYAIEDADRGDKEILGQCLVERHVGRQLKVPTEASHHLVCELLERLRLGAERRIEAGLSEAGAELAPRRRVRQSHPVARAKAGAREAVVVRERQAHDDRRYQRREVAFGHSHRRPVAGHARGRQRRLAHRRWRSLTQWAAHDDTREPLDEMQRATDVTQRRGADVALELANERLRVQQQVGHQIAHRYRVLGR